MGPQPPPVIPNYDVWVRTDGRRRIVVQPQLDCNWFQAMENSVDPAHLQILHQETAFRGRVPVNTTRGFTDEVVRLDFEVSPIGISKQRRYVDGRLEEHPLIFPNILRQGNATQIRVPMDDKHTTIFFIRFDPLHNGTAAEPDADPPVEYVKPYKSPAGALHPQARFRWDEVQAQDHMAWETQGPIADRTVEHLASSDRGVVLLRKLLKDNIDKVQRGEDPLGLVRDPNHAMIDTNLSESLAQGGLR
jgi:5,5'-dehydrodivanillate O-demethylase